MDVEKDETESGFGSLCICNRFIAFSLRCGECQMGGVYNIRPAQILACSSKVSPPQWLSNGLYVIVFNIFFYFCIATQPSPSAKLAKL